MNFEPCVSEDKFDYRDLSLLINFKSTFRYYNVSLIAINMDIYLISYIIGVTLTRNVLGVIMLLIHILRMQCVN